jgi:hypothetical protein
MFARVDRQAHKHVTHLKRLERHEHSSLFFTDRVKKSFYALTPGLVVLDPCYVSPEEGGEEFVRTEDIFRLLVHEDTLNVNAQQVARRRRRRERRKRRRRLLVFGDAEKVESEIFEPLKISTKLQLRLALALTQVRAVDLDQALPGGLLAVEKHLVGVKIIKHFFSLSLMLLANTL